jgi:hypothetical protein
VTGDLLEHVIKEGNAGGEVPAPAAVEIQPDGNPGFERISGYFRLPHRGSIAGWQKPLIGESNSPAAARTAGLRPIAWTNKRA